MATFRLNESNSYDEDDRDQFYARAPRGSRQPKQDGVDDDWSEQPRGRKPREKQHRRRNTRKGEDL